MPHSGRAQVQPVPAPPTSTPAKPQDQASRHNRIPSTEGTVASSLEDEQTPEDPQQQQQYPQSTATAPLTTIDRPAALQSGVGTAAQSPTSPNVAAMVQPDVSNGTLRSSEPSPRHHNHASKMGCPGRNPKRVVLATDAPIRTFHRRWRNEEVMVLRLWLLTFLPTIPPTPVRRPADKTSILRQQEPHPHRPLLIRTM